MPRLGRSSLVWIASITLASVVAGGQVGGAVGASARTDSALQEEEGHCDKPRFHLNRGASEGTWQDQPTPGVSFVSHTDRLVAVFAVAPGYRARVTCVDTQGQNASVTISPEGFVEGPGQITLSSSNDILFVAFESTVTPPPPQPVTPTFDCISPIGNGQYRALFGYANPNATRTEVAIGPSNSFSPAPIDRSQPDVFEANTTKENAFEVVFDGGTITWTLSGQSVSASSTSNACPALLRVDKLLKPENDPGQFQLLIDGAPQASGQNTRVAPSTLNSEVTPGQHTVSETAVAETSLADYNSSIVCRTDGGRGDIVAEEQEGTSLSVPVRAGEHVVCVITNSRKGGPPPEEQTADLMISKLVSQPVAELGQVVTWTVTVTNKGPASATNVEVKDTLPEGVKYDDGSLNVPGGVTCAAAVCTVPLLAAGDSVIGTFRTTATQVGPQVNLVNVDAKEDDPTPGDNSASALLQVVGTDAETVVPMLECVEQLQNGTTRAHFGYLNAAASTQVIQLGDRNMFEPMPHYRGQPDQFDPGRTIDAFQVDFTGKDDPLTWTLGRQQVSASGGSRACNATLRIDKVLEPANDLGRFNLEIDGSLAGSGANVGNQGTTGDVGVAALPAGSVHTVGERAQPGTSAENYDTTIVCRGDGGAGSELGSSNTPSLAVRVAPGDNVVCTIRNARRGGPTPPITPGPEPPVPEPPPPIPPFPPIPPTPGPPPANQPDLAITKVVNPQTITIGSTHTVTVRVTNNGAAPATNVTVRELISLGTALLSVTPSQGSCSAATRSCNLGTLAPGASATITGVVRGQEVGARVNAVVVNAAEADPDLTDNVASALVHIVGPTVCGRLKLNRKMAVLGQRFTLSAQTRTVRRTPVWGLNVQLRGAGVSGAKTTNRYGTAAFSVTPRRPGLLVVTVPPNKRCSGAIGVLGKSAPGVSG